MQKKQQKSRIGQKNLSFTRCSTVDHEKFCEAKMRQIYFRPGLPQTPLWELSTLPKPIVGWGGRCLFPTPHPTRDLRRLVFGAPPIPTVLATSDAQMK